MPELESVLVVFFSNYLTPSNKTQVFLGTLDLSGSDDKKGDRVEIYYFFIIVFIRLRDVFFTCLSNTNI